MKDLQFSEFSFLRQEAGLSIGEAAELLEITLATAHGYENGGSAPRIAELQALRGIRSTPSKAVSNPDKDWFNFTDQSETAAVTPKKTKERTRQSELGQFLTPNSISTFMARLFPAPKKRIQLLDAGAGKGALTAAFIGHWHESVSGNRIVAHGYEMDDLVLDGLRRTSHELSQFPGVEVEVFAGDFIERAATMLRLGKGPRYSHAILNPPYKKINNSSRHRAFLSAIGLETVNLYSGFVGLAVALMEDGGEVVAIIPRSFCNGPYYQPFRRFILSRAAIRHIHLFDARNKAFESDGVLQESIIIRLTCGAVQSEVKISTSADDKFLDYRETVHPFASIVPPSDDGQFIHIPTGDEPAPPNGSSFRHKLDELGLSVSTGPVVDFRMVRDLRADPEPGTVPLLHPGHFTRDGFRWPRPNFKKANAIRLTRETARWLLPCGFYSVVRRFSSKEERRRIVASVVDPSALQAEMIGFENHLNVFHNGKKPLAENLAHGITVYLNSMAVDRCFRRFNGHTQVNATDLRAMGYPSREALVVLGAWAKEHPRPSQEAIDTQVARFE